MSVKHRLVAADFEQMTATEWAEAARWLTPAIERGGEVTLADIEADLMCDLAQLWLAFDGADNLAAALVTQRSGENLHFWLCGGQGCDWRDLFGKVLWRARCDGIRTSTIDGRRGWQRVLKGL